MAVNDACTPAPPRVPGQLERAEIEALAHDDVYTDAELVELDLSEQRASGVELQEVRLTNVTVTGAEARDNVSGRLGPRSSTVSARTP